MKCVGAALVLTLAGLAFAQLDGEWAETVAFLILLPGWYPAVYLVPGDLHGGSRLLPLAAFFSFLAWSALFCGYAAFRMRRRSSQSVSDKR